MQGTEQARILHARVANVELEVIEYSEPSEPSWHAWELEEHVLLPGGGIQARRPLLLNSPPRSRAEALAAAEKWRQSREHFQLEAEV